MPEQYVVHSLHSYFLRPGDTSVPIVYDVDTLRDGRSFATRRVLARQHGRPIFALTANFQIPEDGLEHQDPMPERARARGLPDAWTRPRRAPAAASEQWQREWAALEIRHAGDSREGGGADATTRWPPACGCGSGSTARCPTTR